MLTSYNPVLLLLVPAAGFVIGLALIALWAIGTAPLAALVGRALAARDKAEDQAAIDHGDLTRRQVENAYGPLIMYGPSGEAYDGTVDLPRRGSAL